MVTETITTDSDLQFLITLCDSLTDLTRILGICHQHIAASEKSRLPRKLIASIFASLSVAGQGCVYALAKRKRRTHRHRTQRSPILKVKKQ